MYFKNLNSVRFIAAAFVLVHHIEQLKGLAGYPYRSWFVLGKTGVVLFFSLSGFLTTALLLQEQRETQHIHLRKFYVRRALRIWPLYYLVVGLSIFILPHLPVMQIPGTVDPYTRLSTNLLLLGFLLPNLQLMLVGPIAYISQAWSIGVQEQFYLIWPLLIGVVGRQKHLKYVVMLLLLGFLSVKFSYLLFPPSLTEVLHLNWVNRVLSNTFRLDWMMWGSLFAVLHTTGTSRRWLTNGLTQCLIYAAFFGLLTAGTLFPEIVGKLFFWDACAILAALLLYNLVQPSSLLNLEFRWLGKVGTWSYGIYMLHVLVAWPLIKVFGTRDFVLYPLVFCGTIGLSWLSYSYFERPFLRLKDQFTIVPNKPAVPATSGSLDQKHSLPSR